MLVFRHDEIGQIHAPAALSRKRFPIMSITGAVAWKPYPFWRRDKPSDPPGGKRIGIPLTYCPDTGNYIY